MPILEFLSQPIFYRIGLTLFHSLWEGAVVALVTGLAAMAFKQANHRYVAYLAGFVVMAACPLVPLVAIDIPSNPVSSSHPLKDALASPLRVPPILAESAPKSDTIGWRLPAIERIRRLVDKSQPWVVAVWL